MQNQETELYAEIGKQSLFINSGQFLELESRLKLVQTNLTETQVRLKAVQVEKTKKDLEEQQAEEQCTCPKCGHRIFVSRNNRKKILILKENYHETQIF